MDFRVPHHVVATLHAQGRSTSTDESESGEIHFHTLHQVAIAYMLDRQLSARQRGSAGAARTTCRGFRFHGMGAAAGAGGLGLTKQSHIAPLLEVALC